MSILNYVERQEVDQKLVSNLTKNKYIVIYSSSKQGKTCLRKHCLQPEDHIVVQCFNRWNLVDSQIERMQLATKIRDVRLIE